MQKEVIELKRKMENENDFYGFVFLSKALSTDADDRQWWKVIMIKDGFAFATNGHVGHRIELKGTFENGLYRIVRKTQKEIILISEPETDSKSYPDVEAVFDLDGYHLAFEGLHILGARNVLMNNIFTFIVRKMDEEKTINFDFLRNLNGHYEVHMKGKTNAVIFKNDYETAAIMPLQAAK